MLTFISIVIGFAGLSGILVFTSRADGAGELAETGENFRAGLVCALILSVGTVFILAVWAYPLLALVGVESSLLASGAAVVQAMAIAFPAQFLLAASSYFLEGISRPQRVMAVNLAMLPINAQASRALTSARTPVTVSCRVSVSDAKRT